MDEEYTVDEPDQEVFDEPDEDEDDDDDQDQDEDEMRVR